MAVHSVKRDIAEKAKGGFPLVVSQEALGILRYFEGKGFYGPNYKILLKITSLDNVAFVSHFLSLTTI